MPSIEIWADLLQSVDAIFVSLQYGAVAEDCRILKDAAPDRFIVDQSVDQLIDMDRFAAQIGCLDGVVTISNTGAHLTGAMGIPMFLIRDDWFRRGWPVLTDRIPWKPHTKVMGKNGRPWEEVFEQVKQEIRADLSLKKREG